MLPGERTGLPERPMSVEDVVKMAEEQTFEPQYNIQHYFRTAGLMVKQANIYEHEGNDQMAYFLLYRHARLILSDLPDHPHAKDAQHRKAWSEARKEVNTSLAKLELLKARINRRFQKYVERRRTIAVAHAESRSAKDRTNTGSDIVSDMRRLSMNSRDGDEDISGLDPMKYQDMAVDQANREIQRRIGKLRKKSHTQQQNNNNFDDDNQDMINARKQLSLSEAGIAPPRTSSQRNHLTKSYKYPTVPGVPGSGSGQSYRREGNLSSFTPVNQQQNLQAPIPQRPPKNPLQSASIAYTPSRYTYAPQVPSKDPILPSPPPSPRPMHQFISSAHLENGQSLRTIFLPAPLRQHFLLVAEPNTAARLETCGILCGTLIRNAFFITKLVIPEQTSTTDTCEMINEAALYGYIDAQPEELMVLGWIHTHPTQTCFMSSRDLHTHVWYQVQLPESIAIVCSPSKDPDWGVFRLTDPPGVGAIKTCSKPGIFHPHDETHLFTDVLGRPGHVIEHEELKFELIDLRP